MNAAALLDGYLRRLELEAEPPSVDALDGLLRAHVEHVAWETVWIHEGETWGLDPMESVARIATRGRAGYCYHHNGALAWALDQLGYRVHRHAGAVHGATGPGPDGFGNHLVLTVTDLPSADNPDGTWYVDAGTGDAVDGPLPLRVGAVSDSVMRCELDASSFARGDWTLRHDPRGAFAAMTWEVDEVELDHFTATHHHLSGDADSTFVQWIVAFRREPDRLHRLQGLGYRRYGDSEHRQTIESSTELFELLADVFGIADIDATCQRSIWDRAAAAHEAFMRANSR